MGLFDVFGAGGGKLALQIQSPTVQAGGMLAGVVTFTGGKRAQQIKVLTGRLGCSITAGGAPQSTEVVPTFTIAAAFTSSSGQTQTFPFQVQVPPTAYGSVPGAVSYTFSVGADIDGEIDPGASANINVNGPPFQKGGAPMDKGYPDKGMENPKGGYDKGGYDKGGKGGGLEPGDHCQAQFHDGQWYGATISQFNGKQYEVQWDDGSPGAWLSTDQVAPG